MSFYLIESVLFCKLSSLLYILFEYLKCLHCIDTFQVFIWWMPSPAQCSCSFREKQSI
jgi:hypothetical protein